ncbi:MAG TPA: hypothetical protein VFO05_04385 [Candidatus Limnocylindrales bacterium]|nr:hypothetical protein [Candidatus Limnocylindrales bacterium]
MTGGQPPAWHCPACGAPFANSNATHSCVRVELEERFAGADPAVRAAFDRLIELATVDGPIPIVAQKTRIVLAAPMRFLAVQVGRDRLTGHMLSERPFQHPVVVEIVVDAYGSGLCLHRFSITSAGQLDDAFAAFVRDAASRVGRRERLAKATG